MQQLTGETEFPVLVETNFNFLIENGYHIRSRKYTGFPLAEWIITICSNDLSIEISIDKAQVVINLAIPDKEDIWLDFIFVMMYISKNFEWKYIRLTGEINTDYYNKQLERLSQILQENLEEIKNATTKIVTDRREKKKFDKLVSEYLYRLTLGL